MKFCFPLARVLKINNIWEEQAKLKLAVAMTAYINEEQLLNAKAEYLDAVWSKLTTSGERQARQLGQSFLLTKLAQADCKRQQDKVQQAKAAWTAARQEFVERRTRRQALSSLEEKKYIEFLQAEKRSEGKQLDEVATVSYRRRRE